MKSFIQEKLGGRSKPELPRELSTKGFEEEEEPLDEHDGGRFDEVNMQATGDKQIEDFYVKQQNEMLGEALVAERN